MDTRDQLLNPRLWTREMSAAWHRAIPDLYKAFEALRTFIPDQNASQPEDAQSKETEIAEYTQHFMDKILPRRTASSLRERENGD